MPNISRADLNISFNNLRKSILEEFNKKLASAQSPKGIQGIPGVKGDPGTTDYTQLSNKPTLGSAAALNIHASGDASAAEVVRGDDTRLVNARTPLSHGHAPGDVAGTAVVTADSRLSDARTPVTHDSTKHSVAYEAANVNIQTHVTSAHAPSNAQKNSDITKAEIEAKLTGEIATHTHAGGGADPFLAKLRLAGDITNATVTPAVLTGMVFNFLANSFYVFDMYMLCTSAAATTGYGFAVDVSVAVTNLALFFTHQLATAGTVSGGDSIADNVSRGLSSGVPALTAINFVKGRGILMTGANPGTAQFMFRPEVAASATCKAGSIITVMKIA